MLTPADVGQTRASSRSPLSAARNSTTEGFPSSIAHQAMLPVEGHEGLAELFALLVVALEARADLDVTPRAAVADGVGAGLLDGQHEVVDGRSIAAAAKCAYTMCPHMACPRTTFVAPAYHAECAEQRATRFRVGSAIDHQVMSNRPSGDAVVPQRDLSEREAAVLRGIEARFGPQRSDDLMLTDEGEAVVWVRDGSGSPRLVVNLTAASAGPTDGTLRDEQALFRRRLAPQASQAAGEEHERAVVGRPDDYEALAHWGNALSDQARAKQGPGADALFAAAYEKYAQAQTIQPARHEAIFGWGTALSRQMVTKQGAEADALFAAAGEKYEMALASKPDLHEALFNWAVTLSDHARTKSGRPADALLRAACEKHERALSIKPDKHEELIAWGRALTQRAATGTGKKADLLFAAAGEKYAQALALSPDSYEALNDWGNALSHQAKAKSGDQADALFEAACEKFRQALAIRPDMHEALFNWATTLCHRAMTMPRKKADAVLLAACEKYEQAAALKPAPQQTLLFWGKALSLHTKTKPGTQADADFKAAREKYEQACRRAGQAPRAAGDPSRPRRRGGDRGSRRFLHARP